MSKVLEITEESILKAIDLIENNPIIRIGRESHEYDLVYNEKRYPPILVLSEANKILGGSELTINDFGNSTKNAFVIFEELNFRVQKKEIKFYEELKKFLLQTKTTDLSTRKYINRLLGLEVKVSFGKGVQARVPWIAFLGYGNSVQMGIYPVYLFYKEKSLLILAYGVSETNTPIKNWDLPNLETINNYFKINNLGVPDRYGFSYVYKVYDTSFHLDKDIINSDLQYLLSLYNDKFQGTPISQNVEYPKQLSALIQIDDMSITESFNNSLGDAKIQINTNLVARFICSLISKPFVILTGLSGSGKTKLAQAFAIWMSENKSQYCIVPVGADWTNREPLLGFPNVLKDKDYVKPENRVLELIIESNKNENSNKPYFLILDEMNLSHVERYFADFLSVMESKSKISLHSGNETWSGVPSEIGFPQNLFIIGTVNIDETTYMFSPKVLDRANVIEFSVNADEMNKYLILNSQVSIDKLVGSGTNHATTFIKIARDFKLVPANTDEIKSSLMSFFTELKKIGAEFGYRSAAEILRFVAVVNKVEPTWSIDEIIDSAVMQKLLPKVHGSRRKLEPVLKTLGTLCLGKGINFEDILARNAEIDFTDSNKVKYPISLEKILRMFNNLSSNGFTSYAEA